jgi:hypothetical protein
MRPLLWWPLNPRIVEALLFKEFMSMTVYNPAFLIRDLRQSGIHVEANKDGGIKIVKQFGEKRFELQGVPYFLNLIQKHLFPDSSMSQLIQKCFESVERADLKQSSRVDLDLQFFFE